MFFRKSPADDFVPKASDCPTFVAPLRMYFWMKVEPNNAGGNEDCIVLAGDISSKFLFNDAPCDRKFCMICEADI